MKLFSSNLGETDSDDVIQGIIPFVVSFLLIALSFAVLSFLGVSGLTKTYQYLFLSLCPSCSFLDFYTTGWRREIH